MKRTCKRIQKQDTGVADVCSPSMNVLKCILDKSTIPIVTDQIFYKMREYHKQYRNIKIPLGREGKLNYSKKVVSFKETAEKSCSRYYYVNVRPF